MSALCPFFIKKSYALADKVAMGFPRFMVYGGAVFSMVVGKMVVPRGFKIFTDTRLMTAGLLAYLVAVVMTASLTGTDHIIIYLIALILSVFVWFVLERQLLHGVEKMDFSNLGGLPEKGSIIVRYVASMVCLTLIMCASLAFMFTIYLPSVLVISLAYGLWFIFLMWLVYKRTQDKDKHIDNSPGKGPGMYKLPSEAQDTFSHRERWKTREDRKAAK